MVYRYACGYLGQERKQPGPNKRSAPTGEGCLTTTRNYSNSTNGSPAWLRLRACKQIPGTRLGTPRKTHTIHSNLQPKASHHGTHTIIMGLVDLHASHRDQNACCLGTLCVGWCEPSEWLAYCTFSIATSRPLTFTSMFSGLTSLWKMPFRCIW